MAKGFILPPYPCARKLTDKELDELQQQTVHELKPDFPEMSTKAFSMNTMTLKEITETLQYYFDVTDVKKGEFCKSAGISNPPLSALFNGKKISNKIRFKIVAEMEKRNWIQQPKKEEPKVVMAPRLVLTEAEKRFLTYALYHAHRDDQGMKDTLLDKIISAASYG